MPSATVVSAAAAAALRSSADVDWYLKDIDGMVQQYNRLVDRLEAVGKGGGTTANGSGKAASKAQQERQQIMVRYIAFGLELCDRSR
jgi:hypothetical protein